MATHYKIGTVDPVIRHDPGAGMWNSKPKTQKMSILKSEIRGHLPHAFLIIGDDAARHMNHYFKNTGKDYVIDLQDMIDLTFHTLFCAIFINFNHFKVKRK